jgi:hypothetical protein
MKAKRPMNMMRRTSSANQLSSEAALHGEPHRGDPDLDRPARIQNSERAASMTVVSHPLAAVTTSFSSVVST